MALDRIEPAAAGLDPRALADYVDRLGMCDCHSVMVLRGGKVAAEGWWAPYQSGYNHIAYSLSKSFVSVAVGFAVQEKLLALDDRVIDFFPERFPCAPCAWMREVTLRNLLTMSLGYRGITDHDFYKCADWLDEITHLYIASKPGTSFFYDNRCTFVCSVILQKVTGQTVREYLTPRLFGPLDMRGLWWETTGEGYNQGGWGLNLKTEDIAKFGQFLLNRGMWEGKQLLCPDWIDMAGSRAVENAGMSVSSFPDWQQGYGFYFWQCQPEGVYRGDGAFGQFCIVAPRQDMVVAITAGSPGAQKILRATWDMLDGALSGGAQGQEALVARLDALTIPVPAGEPESEAAKLCSGRKYVFPQNAFGIEWVSVAFAARDTVSIGLNGDVFTAQAGHGTWISTDTGFHKDDFSAMTTFLYADVACASAWNGNEYTVKLAFTRTPFVDTLKLRFGGDVVLFDYQCRPHLPLRGDRIELIGCCERKLRGMTSPTTA